MYFVENRLTSYEKGSKIVKKACKKKMNCVDFHGWSHYGGLTLMVSIMLRSDQSRCCGDVFVLSLQLEMAPREEQQPFISWKKCENQGRPSYHLSMSWIAFNFMGGGIPSCEVDDRNWKCSSPRRRKKLW